MFLLFQSSFRLSEKNEKDKKRKVLTPVSATPTHMLRIAWRRLPQKAGENFNRRVKTLIPSKNRQRAVADFLPYHIISLL